jgi:hypothetical protein
MAITPDSFQAALLCAAIASFVPALPAQAGDAGQAEENWNLHVQATYIRQFMPAFDAAYSGSRSLRTERETSYSFSATAALGWPA